MLQALCQSRQSTGRYNRTNDSPRKASLFIWSRYVVLDLTSSYWFVLVPTSSYRIVTQSNWFSITIVLVRIASYCHRVESHCISLYRISLCLIRIGSQISIIVLIRSWGKTNTNIRIFNKKFPPFASDGIRIDSHNYSGQWDGGFNKLPSDISSFVSTIWWIMLQRMLFILSNT